MPERRCFSAIAGGEPIKICFANQSKNHMTATGGRRVGDVLGEK
jgi:hypothetical protein